MKFNVGDDISFYAYKIKEKGFFDRTPVLGAMTNEEYLKIAGNSTYGGQTLKEIGVTLDDLIEQNSME